MAQGGKCERRVAIKLESAKFLVVLLSQKPPDAPQLHPEAGPTSAVAFRAERRPPLPRRSPAMLRDRSSSSLVPEGYQSH